MDMDSALRLIITKSPNNFQGAIRALRTARHRPTARPVQYVLEQALVDPLANFTPTERAGIAALLGGDDARTMDIRFRVNADEKQAVKDAADTAGLDVSNYIRSLLNLPLVE